MGLRLETDKNSKVHLTINSRTSLWTKDFLIALGIALLTHIAALTLFSVELGSFLNLNEKPVTFLVSADTMAPITSEHGDEIAEIPPFLILKNLKNVDREEISFSVPSPKFDLSNLDLSDFNHPGFSYFTISQGPTFAKEPTQLQSKKICKAKLEFKAESRTGQIFWLNFIESSGDIKLDQQILNELKSAKIQSNSKTIAFHGVIEVEFRS